MSYKFVSQKDRFIKRPLSNWSKTKLYLKWLNIILNIYLLSLIKFLKWFLPNFIYFSFCNALHKNNKRNIIQLADCSIIKTACVTYFAAFMDQFIR